MKVTKDFTFSAAHFIPGHRGRCANLHGHNYKVTVGIHGLLDDGTGMVVDFEDIKGIMKPLVALVDHKNLNDYMRVPTAENIAVWFGSILHRLVDKHVIKVVEVTVQETDTCTAGWNTVNDLDLVHRGEGWRVPDSASEELKEALNMARREATQQVNTIILANRPRVAALGGGATGGGISQ